MESIGLIPSDTGRPGGKKTGQHMADYPADTGLFIEACKAFVKKGHALRWIDRIAASNPSLSHMAAQVTPINAPSEESELLLDVAFSEVIEDIVSHDELAAKRASKAKTKYQCEVCHSNVWGKPGMKLICADCDAHYAVV